MSVQSADAWPVFRLEEFFIGPVSAWGVFEDRFGTVRRQFAVDLNGTWDGETLTLDERFTYNDGETETRVWRITPDGENRYIGASDAAPNGAIGVARRNEFHWSYDFLLPMHGRRVKVRFDDRMWLQPDGVVLNRARVRKMGVLLGAATIAFKRADAALAVAAE